MPKLACRSWICLQILFSSYCFSLAGITVSVSAIVVASVCRLSFIICLTAVCSSTLLFAHTYTWVLGNLAVPPFWSEMSPKFFSFCYLFACLCCCLLCLVQWVVSPFYCLFVLECVCFCGLFGKSWIMCPLGEHFMNNFSCVFIIDTPYH